MGSKAGEEGSGGGGGVMVKPVGYIEMKNGNTTFKPIRDPKPLLRAVAIGGIIALLTVRSMARRLRRNARKPYGPVRHRYT